MRFTGICQVVAVVTIGCFLTIGVRAQGLRPAQMAKIAAIVEAPTSRAGTDVVERLRVSLPAGVHVNSDQPRDRSLVPFVVTPDVSAGVSVVATTFPPASELQVRATGERLSVFEGEFTVDVRLRLAATLGAGPLRVPVHVRYQACDETRCYFPASETTAWEFTVLSDAPAIATTSAPTSLVSIAQDRSDSEHVAAALDRFVVTKTAAGYLQASDFLAFVASPDVKPAATAFAGRGLLAVLGLVFIGGFALNLTPCVLPLIPVNLAILGAGKTAVSRRRGLLLGAAYGGAMAVVYGALGSVVVLTSRAFGAINASPWFNAAIAVVFTLLALSMFEVFFLDFSRYSSRLRFSPVRGSLVLAITMGGVAALLAGACVAPVVVQVVVLSSDLYASGTKAALALPFLLGLGMAAPWPFAGAGLAALPRPGAWMIRVKQVFGIAILLLAAFYAHSSYRLFADRVSTTTRVDAASTADGWETSLDRALADAEREHKPVFVDLWATWCKNCLAMDQTTFADARVRSALARYVTVKVDAEDPDDPAIRGVMKRLGAVGLPTYAVLEPAAAPPMSAAPQFSLEDLAGRTARLDQWHGRVVVLNFWATWCPSCKTEIPELIRLRATFPERDVVIAGIATDEQGRAVVSPFVERERFVVDGVSQSLNYPVLIGTSAVADTYRVESLPTTVVLDPQGVLARRIDAPVRFADIESDIRKLLTSSGNRSRPADGGLNMERKSR